MPQADVKTTLIDVPHPDPHLKLPDPRPIDTAPVQFKILTPETIPEGDYVFYGLSVKDYETMARNMADILRWVREAEWRLRYYKGEIDDVSTQ